MPMMCFIAVIGCIPVMTGCRVNNIVYFCFSVSIREILCAFAARPVLNSSVCCAIRCNCIMMCKRMTCCVNSHISKSGLNYSRLIREYISAFRASPICSVSVIGAGGSLCICLNERMPCRIIGINNICYFSSSVSIGEILSAYGAFPIFYCSVCCTGMSCCIVM